MTRMTLASRIATMTVGKERLTLLSPLSAPMSPSPARAIA